MEFSPCIVYDDVLLCLTVQITPGLGLIAALLVAFVVKEPLRGSSDHRTTKGVKGRGGLSAYLHDLCYLLSKYFITCNFHVKIMD